MKTAGFSFLPIFLIVIACVKVEPVSIIPEIHFEDIESGLYVDTSLGNNTLPYAKLSFSFIDGDADIGIYQSTINDPNAGIDEKYNVFLSPYYYLDTTYYPIEIDTASPPYYRIIYDSKLDRVGQNKTIKGKIDIIVIDLPIYDSVRYEFYITDRAGHKSNIDYSTNIGVKSLFDSINN